MLRLALLPPLAVLCTELLFQKPVSLAFPIAPREPTEQERSLQAASSRRRGFVISHPPTDSCVLRGSLGDPLKLGPCNQSDAWNYTPQRFLTVKGTYYCLQPRGPGKPAKLGIVCTEEDSSWELLPGEEPGLLTRLPDGQSVCLEANPDGTVFTGPCGGRTVKPESQWFQVDPQRSYVAAEVIQGKNE